MFNPFKKLELIETEVFMSMPAKFRKKQRSAWSDPNRQGAEVECFLEGPSFDREGNLWFVDIPFGRVFRITPSKEWELVTQYDGWPNGLKIHKDGRIFICDYKEGLLVCQLGVGIWRFDANMLPTHLIHSPDHKHHHLANIAAGGPDLKTLYITESLSGDILMAKLPVAGKKLYSHQ